MKTQARGGDGNVDAVATLRPTFARLSELAELQPDWDSYGGLPPSPNALAMARRVAEAVAQAAAQIADEDAVPRAVSPLADGGVQLAWQGMGCLVEIDIDPDGRLGYLLREGTGATARYEEDDDISWARMIGLVRRVLAS